MDGVILFNDNFSEEELEILHDYHIPMVVVGSKVHEPEKGNIGNIYVNFENLAYEIANRYFVKGIDDIALVEDKLNMGVMKELKVGIERAFQDHGKTFTNYIQYDDSFKTSYSFLTHYFSKNKPNRVVITLRDSQAKAVLNASSEAGYTIPDDSELICILNNKYLSMVRPNVSTYNLPEYDMGAVSMRLLTKMLEEQEIPSKNIEMSYSYNPRNTTK